MSATTPAAVAANRARLAKAIGLGPDRVVWMNQVHGDHVEVVDGPRQTAFDDTDGLVTRTPRLALAVVSADCVPVLLADARAGVVGAVHAGRVGAQNGVVARAVEAMVSLGAHEPDISVLLGPAVSGRNYEVPAAMADEVEAALPGSRTTTAAGTPGLDLRAGIVSSTQGFGDKRHRRRPAVHGRRHQPVQPPPWRPDRAAGLGGVDGMSVAVNRSPRPEREMELADSLAALRSRLAAAAEAAGRKLDDIQLLPITKFFPATDVAILSRLGCAAFGESRDQEAAAKVAEVDQVAGRLGPRAIPRPVAGTGTWSAQSSATRPGRWPAGRTPPIRSAAPGW